MFGLGSRASSMRSICVTTEFQLLGVGQLQHFLESSANLHERILATPFAGCSSPKANSVESFANIDDDAHDLIVSLILERFTNGSELSM